MDVRLTFKKRLVSWKAGSAMVPAMVPAMVKGVRLDKPYLVMRGKHWLGIGASILLGLIFFTFGLGKLPYYGEFLALILAKSFLTLSQAIIVVRWLPWIEVVLGSLLIIGIATKLMASFSAVLIVAFIANNSWMIYHGLGDEPCGCPGVIENLGTMSVIDSLYLDMGMLVLVLIILFCYLDNFLTIRPWFFRKR